MASFESCLYRGTHSIPVYHQNGFKLEIRDLNVYVSDVGDKLQIKLTDPSDYAFNYTEPISMADFEVLRTAQCLDINYLEFKTNIVEMFHQFDKQEMLLKIQLSQAGCLLTFFTKSKIKHIVYLTLELHLTDQKEIILEMQRTMQQLQNSNSAIQKQLQQTQQIVRNRESEIEELHAAKRVLLKEFHESLQQIEKLLVSKLQHLQQQVLRKTSNFEQQLKGLQTQVARLRNEAQFNRDFSMQLSRNMQRLKEENQELVTSAEALRKENSSLNILRTTLERNIVDLKGTTDELKNENQILETRNKELENDLSQLSIAVAQKDAQLKEYTKDLVQANNMIVQFNSHYDSKVQQIEELQNVLASKEKLLLEHVQQKNQVLRAFEEYKTSFNEQKFEQTVNKLKQEVFNVNQKNSELEEEIRKLNKMNAILTQRFSQGHKLNLS